jgi:ElaB/YqjD/DUF883 family membrane-anchored ribosome-binding protein
MNKNGITGDTGASTANVIDDKIDSLRDTMKGVVEQGSQKVDAIKTKVVEIKDQAVSRGGDLLSSTASLIKAHPIKSVAVAFGVGYLGMRLFRR